MHCMDKVLDLARTITGPNFRDPPPGSQRASSAKRLNYDLMDAAGRAIPCSFGCRHRIVR
jgi:hypothetical protein